MTQPTEDEPEDGRVSLAPLDPVAVLRALLQVKPDDPLADDQDDDDAPAD